MPVVRIGSVDPLLLPESSAWFLSVERIESVDSVQLPISSAQFVLRGLVRLSTRVASVERAVLCPL